MTASVDVADTRPAATFVIVRSAPLSPILNVPTAVPPAKLYVLPPITPELVDTAVSVTDLAPRAMLLSVAAFALVPIAIESTPSTVAFVPIAMPFSFVVVAL